MQYVFVCVVSMTAECLCCEFVFVVFYLLFVLFFCKFICFCFCCCCIFYVKVLWHSLCVLCAGVMCSHTLYACARVMRMTADCGCVVSLCFAFFIYCWFYFSCNIFLSFYVKLCGTCIVYVCCARKLCPRGRFMCSHVPCA